MKGSKVSEDKDWDRIYTLDEYKDHDKASKKWLFLLLIIVFGKLITIKINYKYLLDLKNKDLKMEKYNFCGNENTEASIYKFKPVSIS